ncbi:MAG: hypothetical protein ABI772_08605 [Bacteroidota bacterium]
MKANLPVLTVLAAMIFSLLLLIAQGGEDVNQCVVKYKSEWGKPCTNCTDYSKSYRAYFRNECYTKLDVKVAAQENDLRWKTYTILGMGPQDTIVAYACKGTGKYMIWPKKSGDTSIELPSDDQINQLYNK